MVIFHLQHNQQGQKSGFGISHKNSCQTPCFGVKVVMGREKKSFVSLYAELAMFGGSFGRLGTAFTHYYDSYLPYHHVNGNSHACTKDTRVSGPLYPMPDLSSDYRTVLFCLRPYKHVPMYVSWLLYLITVPDPKLMPVWLYDGAYNARYMSTRGVFFIA